MNINRLNLNLLKAFVFLYKTRSVSKAANALSITQPAMSNLLKQLRVLLNDQLFIRSHKQLIPTQKATEIAPTITQHIEILQQLVFSNDRFEPKTDKKTFIIAMNDYLSFTLLPQIIKAISVASANITLRIIAIEQISSWQFFIDNKVDLAIGMINNLEEKLAAELLFNEEAMVVFNAASPYAKIKLTKASYLNAEHLAINIHTDSKLSVTDISLSRLKLSRKIKVAVPHIISALEILANTGLIGTLPKSLAEAAKKNYHLQIQKPPIAIPKIKIYQVWPEYLTTDKANNWLRKTVQKVLFNSRITVNLS